MSSGRCRAHERRCDALQLHVIFMSKRSNGLLSGRTRHLARHHRPSSLSIRTKLKKLEVGEDVAIVPKGNFGNIPHPRYRGKVGKITEVRGNAYVVNIRIDKAHKKIIVPQMHIEKINK